MIVSAGSPAAERAWLISASTCAAAVPPAAPDGLADADGLAEADAAFGRADGEREDAEADGDVLAWRGGTVTTAGGAAMAR